MVEPAQELVTGHPTRVATAGGPLKPTVRTDHTQKPRRRVAGDHRLDHGVSVGPHPGECHRNALREGGEPHRLAVTDKDRCEAPPSAGGDKVGQPCEVRPGAVGLEHPRDVEHVPGVHDEPAGSSHDGGLVGAPRRGVPACQARMGPPYSTARRWLGHSVGAGHRMGQQESRARGLARGAARAGRSPRLGHSGR